MDELIRTVKFNCDVSDARYWGYFSVCGLLMRMRDLYRSEMGLKPWQPIAQEKIMKWISEKESLWKTLESRDLQSVKLKDNLYSPFDVTALNALLNKEGYIYGAGYGLYMKPTFFISRLQDKKEVNDYTVYIAREELIRDLFSSVAMLQGRCIFIRIEPLKSLLWEKFINLRTKEDPYIKGVFQRYGLIQEGPPDEDFEKRLDGLALRYSEMLLYHEIAEAVEDIYDWNDLISNIKERRIELILRALKDTLADTSDYGPIKSALEKGDIEMLRLYVDFMEGYRLIIYPSLIDVVREGDMSLIEITRKEAYKKALYLRDNIVELFRASRLDEVKDLLKRELRAQ